MSKVALVLSGGGAKGAFQAAVAKYAHEVKGYQWCVICGVSIGAINGSLMAMDAYDKLEHIWRTLERGNVMTGHANAWGYLRLLWSPSVYDHAPLARMIERDLDLSRMTVPLVIGAVSLETGKYVTFRPDGSVPFAKTILASTSIPIAFSPVDIEGYGPMVDGGIRNIAPIGDALAFEPDKIVVIDCASRRKRKRQRSFFRSLAIGRRALEIMTDEIFMNDVRNFTRVNDLVLQAEKQGCALVHPSTGKPYRGYESVIIRPDEELSDTLDFSRESLDHNWDAGWAMAKRVFG